MTRLNGLVAAIFTGLVLTGCLVNKNITREDAGNLERGMSIRVAEAVLQKPTLDAYLVTHETKMYLVNVYGLASGDYSNRYFLVFDSSDKLFYWGFRDEFTRANDPILSGIGQQLR